MATQVRSKPASKAPVTRHPLFPAMVALWFGALFGLGSLAVRASLIESLVLSLSLDVLLPAAAPPLGLKFRLILALLMAAVGIALGAMLGRRIARPKEVVTPRRRSVNARRERRPDAPAAPVNDSPMSRRRPLTVKTDESPRDHYEMAPLPGGAPAILDVTQFDLAPAMEESPGVDGDPIALDTFALADSPVEEAPVYEATAEPELSRFSDYAEAETDAVMATEAEIAADEQALELSTLAEEPSRQTFQAPESHRQTFRPAEPEAAPDTAHEFAPEAETVSSLEDADAATPLNFQRPFAMPQASEEMPLELEPEIGAEAAIGEVDVTDAPSDDYARMIDALRSEPAPPPVVAVDHESRAPEPAVVDPIPLPQLPASFTLAPLALPELTPQASSRIETAPLAELSPVELIERLAIAMRQRESRAPLPAALANAIVSFATSVDAPGEAETPLELEIEDALADPVELAAVAAPEPESASDAAEDAGSPSSLTPALPLALPAAMRPIAFDDHDDALDLPLPPRSFAAPGAIADIDTAEDLNAEDNYSSLLDLARPGPAKQEFVRIDEPEADGPEIEPVVIFPGHGARAGMRFAAPDAAEPDVTASETHVSAVTEPTQLRRFDAPATTAASTAPALASGIRQDPEEAQRALRSALATLQRMSGAA